MEKSKIAATLPANRSAEVRSPADPGSSAADRVPDSRLLADWELVLVGGGEMTQTW